MKLTRSVSYALGILLQIDRLGDDGHVTAAKIARGCRFPPRFLYRILRRMVDAGLLRGTSGPGGGYALARSPRQITLLDIVEGIEATPEGTRLTPVCPQQRPAIEQINRLCQQSAKKFAADLRRINLADLKRRRKKSPARRRAR